ncbi:MAG: MipA/OmpV family protein [Fusobacteriaceae bacterium]|jgi:outer membrane scaffolding protein for murein synthesis (MipA/OmpV family)|nr:MipA/OmpV family protein [Fusobacteriaceae bacterium]
MKKILMIFTLLTTSLAFAGDEITPANSVGLMGSYNKTLYHADAAIVAIPAVNFEFDRVFLRSPLEFGVIVYEESGFRFSLVANPLIGYFDGWSAKSTDFKGGYDEIRDRKSFPAVGGSIEAMFSDDFFTDFSGYWGEKGIKATALFGKTFELPDRFTLIPSLSARYYSRSYIDHFLGINAREVAENLGITKTYRGKSVFSGCFDLSLEMGITDNAALNLFGGMELFEKEVQKSDIVKTNVQFYGGVGLRFVF